MIFGGTTIKEKEEEKKKKHASHTSADIPNIKWFHVNIIIRVKQIYNRKVNHFFCVLCCLTQRHSQGITCKPTFIYTLDDRINHPMWDLEPFEILKKIQHSFTLKD